eukprot:scaffold16942_cov151-Skeletonema_dohrnii-CCMP3373.AAC.1
MSSFEDVGRIESRSIVKHYYLCQRAGRWSALVEVFEVVCCLRSRTMFCYGVCRAFERTYSCLKSSPRLCRILAIYVE